MFEGTSCSDNDLDSTTTKLAGGAGGWIEEPELPDGERGVRRRGHDSDHSDNHQHPRAAVVALPLVASAVRRKAGRSGADAPAPASRSHARYYPHRDQAQWRRGVASQGSSGLTAVQLRDRVCPASGGADCAAPCSGAERRRAGHRRHPVGFDRGRGERIVRTPRLDRLAAEGIRFTQARVTTSICMVSRATLLTGQYMSRHGIDQFGKPLTPEAFASTYPGLLRAPATGPATSESTTSARRGRRTSTSCAPIRDATGWRAPAASGFTSPSRTPATRSTSCARGRGTSRSC